MKSIRIMVVEDEGIIALDLVSSLRRLGYSVIGPVGDGEAALSLMATSAADLVLMDIHLAGPLDGIETARQIRNQFNVPCVFLTAYSDAGVRDHAQSAQPLGYLSKPFEEGDLSRGLSTAIEQWFG